MEKWENHGVVPSLDKRGLLCYKVSRYFWIA